MKNEKTENPGEVKENVITPSANKAADKQAIDNHKKAAAHNMEAAKHHLEAAKSYESGNRKKAAHSTLLASGHHAIAGEFLSDDAKHHAQKLKVNYRD
jgi:hypothetical protein